MKIMQSYDKPELGKVYQFNIGKVNEIKSIRVLQVLFELTEEGKETEAIYYVQNYGMDINKDSMFMELLEWCQVNDAPHVYGYDTDELVGIRGEGCVTLNDCGEQQFKFISTEESHWCEVEGYEYLEDMIKSH